MYRPLRLAQADARPIQIHPEPVEGQVDGEDKLLGAQSYRALAAAKTSAACALTFTLRQTCATLPSLPIR